MCLIKNFQSYRTQAELFPIMVAWEINNQTEKDYVFPTNDIDSHHTLPSKTAFISQQMICPFLTHSPLREEDPCIHKRTHIWEYYR